MMMMPRRHPIKVRRRYAILILLVLSITTDRISYVIGHPALPIPNARPPKKLFAETNANAGDGDGDGALHTGAESSDTPPSQLESIVANAKSLTASWGKKNMDLTNPTLRSRYVSALTAGLAVSLAMVPEAVSFSCECSSTSFINDNFQVFHRLYFHSTH